jgi:hypothetical protein
MISIIIIFPTFHWFSSLNNKYNNYIIRFNLTWYELYIIYWLLIINIIIGIIWII